MELSDEDDPWNDEVRRKGVVDAVVKTEVGVLKTTDELGLDERKVRSPWRFSQSRKSVHLFLPFIGRKECRVS